MSRNRVEKVNKVFFYYQLNIFYGLVTYINLALIVVVFILVISYYLIVVVVVGVGFFWGWGLDYVEGLLDVGWIIV